MTSSKARLLAFSTGMLRPSFQALDLQTKKMPGSQHKIHSKGVETLQLIANQEDMRALRLGGGVSQGQSRFLAALLFCFGSLLGPLDQDQDLHDPLS